MIPVPPQSTADEVSMPSADDPNAANDYVAATTRQPVAIGLTLLLLAAAIVFLIGAGSGAIRHANEETVGLTALNAALRGGLLMIGGGLVACAFGWVATRLGMPRIIGGVVVMAMAFGFLGWGYAVCGLDRGEPLPQAVDGLLHGTLIGAIVGGVNRWRERNASSEQT